MGGGAKDGRCSRAVEYDSAVNKEEVLIPATAWMETSRSVEEAGSKSSDGGGRAVARGRGEGHLVRALDGSMFFWAAGMSRSR